jgi:hypothetical protein
VYFLTILLQSSGLIFDVSRPERKNVLKTGFAGLEALLLGKGWFTEGKP